MAPSAAAASATPMARSVRLVGSRMLAVRSTVAALAVAASAWPRSSEITWLGLGVGGRGRVRVSVLGDHISTEERWEDHHALPPPQGDGASCRAAPHARHGAAEGVG
eukprot:scaffold104825_cov39-Phaeocystis_antarctica.AAC.2